MYECIKSTVIDHFAVVLTDEQVKCFIEAQPEALSIYVGKKETGMDTYDRDLLCQMIIEDVLGKGQHWPINGDGADAFPPFWREFVLAANTKGYTIEIGMEDYSG